MMATKSCYVNCLSAPRSVTPARCGVARAGQRVEAQCGARRAAYITRLSREPRLMTRCTAPFVEELSVMRGPLYDMLLV